ncbi:unnamed protein product [Aphanomyces euteiches]|uniref:Uncharacterized protein n=1 Tax=Aphanomyces euteiches TaxID=100861 RepID=A0A6G0WM00_9STRA|nr:hypothetical protein Ae201684_013867 [Aphanomyces euteiches]KAH9080866.1 hypothetical protein Ae201684P_007952 [Aphanomyces euteiches]KAH9153715.1 hypothetical protein AeRB84_004076 [Aphanomyces euteiches]
MAGEIPPSTSSVSEDQAETNTAVTNVAVASLEVASSFLRLKHTGVALSQCLKTAAVAIENPLIIQALRRILEMTAAACESELVMDSVATSMETAAAKLKQESVTIESFVQVVLQWSTVFLTWIHTFLDKDQLAAILDTFGPVAASFKVAVDYSMSYPAVAYLVNQVTTHARAHLSTERLFGLVQRSHSALSRAHALTSSAWSYVYPQRIDIARRNVHALLLKRCNMTFSVNAMDDMISMHVEIQRALLQLALEQGEKIAELDKSLAETNAYATEVAEALARGPRVTSISSAVDAARIQALETELAAANAYANELAEAIARGPRRDPQGHVELSECFGSVEDNDAAN